MFLFASTAFVGILVLSASIGTFAFRFMASMGGVKWTPVVAEVMVGMLAWIAVVPPLTGLSWPYTIGIAVVMNLVAGGLAFAVNLGVRRALRS